MVWKFLDSLKWLPVAYKHSTTTRGSVRRARLCGIPLPWWAWNVVRCEKGLYEGLAYDRESAVMQADYWARNWL